MNRASFRAACCAALVMAGAVVLSRADDGGSKDSEIEARVRQEALRQMTPEQRAAELQARRDRMERRLLLLRKKKEAGKLTGEEEVRLEKLEEFQRRHTRLVLRPVAETQDRRVTDAKTAHRPVARPLKAAEARK